MSRCRICDKQYSMHFLARFLNEGYCPTCEEEISSCLQELENYEEVEDEENFD